jgi:hypothetical protein
MMNALLHPLLSTTGQLIEWGLNVTERSQHTIIEMILPLRHLAGFWPARWSAQSDVRLSPNT